ncbi:hypothetical protein J6590_101185, partial [Homalodisca vitripennis]
MKNWYSPIMMERFGRGVVLSWRENNIKNEEEGGEEEVEDGIRKATFGSASACVHVREKSLLAHFNYHLTFSVILGWTRQHSAPRQIFPFTLTIPSPISDAITYRSSAIALLPFRFEGREG